MAKKKDSIYMIIGFLVILGVSGLIYGMLPYPYPLFIGSTLTGIGLILFFVAIIRELKRKKRKRN